MKKTRICLAALFMVIFCFTVMAEVNQDPQKFKVTYTVIYNALTLKEASRIETQIKGNHKNACRIKTKVDSADNTTGTITFSSPGAYIIDADSLSVGY